jgi:hypothetical protein
VDLPATEGPGTAPRAQSDVPGRHNGHVPVSDMVTGV